MKRHYVYSGFVVLFVLMATTQTQARIQPNPNISQNKVSKGVVFVNHDQLLQIAKNLGVTVHTVKVSKNNLAKLAASGSKGCGCALEDSGGPGGWPCMRGCLQDAGVSSAAVAVCVGACIAAGAENPVGLWLCAICVGASDILVLECSVKCSGFIMQNVGPKLPLRPGLRREQTRGGNSAKVRLNTIRSGALR